MLDQLGDKTIILGVIALDGETVESPETVANRLRRGLAHRSASQIIAAPDCGMKYLSREAAFAKLQSLVAGARQAAEDPVAA